MKRVSFGLFRLKCMSCVEILLSGQCRLTAGAHRDGEDSSFRRRVTIQLKMILSHCSPTEPGRHIPAWRRLFSRLPFLCCAEIRVWLGAQKRVEAGLLLDYLSVSQTQTDNFGVGGRLGFRVHHNVMVEGELAYDYGVNFREVYNDIASGNVTAIEQTSIGVTEGLFGPKFQPAHGHLRPFVTLKGGFIDFRLSPSLIPYSGVTSAVLGIRDSNCECGCFIRVAAATATLGPLGLRLEFGDLIYFNDGAHNNLRITFGPILRF